MEKVNNIRQAVQKLDNPILLKGIYNKPQPKIEKCLQVAEQMLNKRDTSHKDLFFNEMIESFFLLGNKLFCNRKDEHQFTRLKSGNSNKDTIATMLYTLAVKARYTNIIGVNLIVPAYATSCAHVATQPGFIINIKEDLC
ncbi:hypothetical protein BKG94_05355 [Rodentibacter ratti]|uniref:hypothetical protein n=1 Tax=Rodentibacter ratti TaxID=1906745 RepID=UPI000985427D|nr:hypothetical protein [Rodentibacter ratti]OOF88569.1 hypothetical protein BKG94_05355 [Rodentibacter ratti]